MRRWHVVGSLILILALPTLACSLGGGPGSTETPGVPQSLNGTVVVATSSIPTATSLPAVAGNVLAPGTLILVQLGNALALPPGAKGSTTALTAEQIPPQGSPDGHYSVRFTKNGALTDLSLVDFSSADTSTGKDIPNGKGLSNPSITWKEDSSGFAFYEVQEVSANSGKGSSGIRYYDVASGQTIQLVPATQPGSAVSSIAFSPDGKRLAYASLNLQASASGGGNQLYVVDVTAASAPLALPAGANNFNQWLRNSSGFIAMQIDTTGTSKVAVYTLADLAHPRNVTPANTSDLLADGSPDGKFLVVSSALPAVKGQLPPPANIAIMNLDGSARRNLTQFTSPDQTITSLIWGNDGIYYSLSGIAASGNNPKVDTTYRMGLDGSNVQQVGQGTLSEIIGVH
ncbi:MAG TPA: hypothetical protein VKQ72_09655 [Aggregatilineales bacterium]|nr:hypothetical protein [Aggregatilineales bacterium]